MTLRAIRSSRGIPQKVVAATLDVDQALVSRWESGQVPMPKSRDKLCRFYGVAPADVIWDTRTEIPTAA